MSARHAVLGLLIQKPDYPYKLAARFADQIGPAWQVNVGQIYQTIERLEREGLIEVTGSNPSTRGTRNTYDVTEVGVEEFERWIEEDNESIRPQRGMLLLKLAMSDESRADQLIAAIDRQERDCLRTLQEYSNARRGTDRPGNVRWRTVTFRLILDSAIKQLESEINWLRQARQEIELHAGLAEASPASANGSIERSSHDRS